MSTVTICVGTIRRPYCIQRFIKSVRANFPDISIIVGDQDRQNPYLDTFYRGAGVEVVYVEEDAGVGEARNAAVARCSSEFILFCDDDFLFSSETRLDHPLAILREDPAIDIVGGAVRDVLSPLDARVSKLRRWEHFFVRDPKRRILMTTLIDSFSPRRKEVRGVPYFLADSVLNWKLARRSAFERGAAWDPRFKCNGEHSDFYLNLKENTDLGVAYCPSFVVYHHSPDDFSYSLRRNDPEGFRLLSEKWGIEEVLDISSDQPRMILARDWKPVPQAETADPGWTPSGATIPIDASAPGPLDVGTWPASRSPEAILPSRSEPRVLLPYGEMLTAKDGDALSLLVAIENRSGERIGCLGPFAPVLTYGVERDDGAHAAIPMGTPLCQDLTPGITFHFVNFMVDWDADEGETFDLDIHLATPDGEALGQGAKGMIKVHQAGGPASPSSRQRVIDFSEPDFPSFIRRVHGLSFRENWGRWSDGNVSKAVMLRFVDPLPGKFWLELSCQAYGPNAGSPVRVEIGGETQSFLPKPSESTYVLEFTLDAPERSIHIYPPFPTSPVSRGESIDDGRLLGLGFVSLKIVALEPELPNGADSAPFDSLFATTREELAFWENLYTREDPWNYRSAYEQEKYARTLELVPAERIASALELGCAEGLFTEMLAPRVQRLIGLDISGTALQRARTRCARLPHVTFACADLSERFPEGPFDLIVCSEVLYYLQDESALSAVAARVGRVLVPGGHLVMAHANNVSDDRTTTGFDFAEIGAVFIGSVFAAEPELEFLKELRTPLYRIQLFRRRGRQASRENDLPGGVRQPREILERPVNFVHPLIRWGGCAITSAEARYFYETDRVPILTYHRIASNGPSGLEQYRTDPAVFERQLAYLQRYGYMTASADEIGRSYGDVDRRPGKWIALTFDNAYQDFAEIAWPLLKRYGCAATVFVPTGHIGGHAEWDRAFGEPAPLMDWDTLRSLQSEGVTFGSHGVSHRLLPSLGPKDLAEELRRSRGEIAQELGKAPRGFCFPYTEYSARVIEAAREAGYDYTVGGDVPAEDIGAFILPRIEIRGDMDMDAFIAALPPLLASSEARRDAYSRMHAIRHRRTYFPFDPAG